MLLVLHVGYSPWTSPLLIRRLAVRRGSLKARGVLLWGGGPARSRLCAAGGMQAVCCVVPWQLRWCLGCEPGRPHPQAPAGRWGPSEAPGLIFFPSSSVWKRANQTYLLSKGFAALPSPFLPLLSLSVAQLLLCSHYGASSWKRLREPHWADGRGPGKRCRAADKKSEVSGKTKGLDLL